MSLFLLLPAAATFPHRNNPQLLLKPSNKHRRMFKLNTSCISGNYRQEYDKSTNRFSLVAPVSLKTHGSSFALLFIGGEGSNQACFHQTNQFVFIFKMFCLVKPKHTVWNALDNPVLSPLTLSHVFKYGLCKTFWQQEKHNCKLIFFSFRVLLLFVVAYCHTVMAYSLE